MTFNSLPYALFLPVVVIVYWLLPARAHLPGRPGVRWRQCWLLSVSYVFYGAFDSRFALLLAFTTAVDYSVARWLDGPLAERPDRARKRALAISIGVNLAVLGFFKYAGFFVDQASDLFARAGLPTASFGLRILLPYGISFYTFQSIGYAVDVYRRRIPACRNALDFATFVAFFPQLVAGPISRAKDLLPADPAGPAAARQRPGDLGPPAHPLGPGQEGRDRRSDGAHRGPGVRADARPVAVDALLLGVLAFAVQIYGDFSGYTDMARGSARLLGVELVHNFDQPYLSSNITEFWRRWHISLSTWLRDYLYMPLGGNRGPIGRTYRNLMLTMLLGGLWHGGAGSSWSGACSRPLPQHRAGARRAGHREPRAAGACRRLPAVVLTFSLVCLAWVPFRAASGRQALDMLAALGRSGGQVLTADQIVLVGVAACATLALDVVLRLVTQPLRLLDRFPLVAGSLAGIALVCIIVFSGGAPVPFIYFQF